MLLITKKYMLYANLSVFLPKLPDEHGIEFLNFYEINFMWIEKDEIYSNNSEFPFKFKKL